jgi:hypothetical protein
VLIVDDSIYFNQKGRHNSHELLPIFSKLPVENKDWNAYSELESRGYRLDI